MAIRDIITPKDPTLRQKAAKVTDFKAPKLQALIDDMVETMQDAAGVGLAAPQVAISQRIIVVRLPDDDYGKEEYGKDAGVLHVLVNPEIIISSSTMVEGTEACLSIPGLLGSVDRHEMVTIKGQDRHGKPIRIRAKGWLARVFQHEIDHLDGILFVDRANRIWKPEDESVAKSEPAD